MIACLFTAGLVIGRVFARRVVKFADPFVGKRRLWTDFSRRNLPGGNLDIRVGPVANEAWGVMPPPY